MISKNFENIYNNIQESDKSEFQNLLKSMITKVIREELGLDEAPQQSSNMLKKFEKYTMEFFKELFGESGDASYDKEVIKNHFSGSSFGGNVKSINESLVSAFVIFQETSSDADSETDFFNFLLDGSVGEIEDFYNTLKNKMIVGSSGTNLYDIFHKFMENLYTKLYDLNMKS
jgi:hypothetical protein